MYTDHEICPVCFSDRLEHVEGDAVSHQLIQAIASGEDVPTPGVFVLRMRDKDASDAMIQELRRLAADIHDEREVVIDFEGETVSAC